MGAVMASVRDAPLTSVEILDMVSAGEGTYSAASVTGLLLLTATCPEGIMAGAVHYGRDGYVPLAGPFERDPGVYCVLLGRGRMVIPR